MNKNTQKKAKISEDITIKKLSHILGMRNLFDEIYDYEGEHLFDEVLTPWVAKSNYIDCINDVSASLYQNYTTLNSVHTMELYALSRVLDLLTLPFQETSCSILIEDRWKGHALSLAEYTSFIEALGLTVLTPHQFHAFNCEVFEAEQGQENFHITKTIFPAVYLNNLLIKRAGVFINLDENYDLEYINTAKMYWTYERNNRPCEDQSHGWGHNSQWGTNLRIDLQTETGFIYNEHGDISLNVPSNDVTLEHKQYLVEDDLSIADAVELLTNRQLISTPKKDVGFYPFDFKYEE